MSREWVAAIAFMAGALFGVAVHANGTDPAICHEDEVLTATAECVALDDADYVGGKGWVAR